MSGVRSKTVVTRPSLDPTVVGCNSGGMFDNTVRPGGVSKVRLKVACSCEDEDTRPSNQHIH